MSRDEKEILGQVQKSVAEVLRIPVTDVKEDSRLGEDLDAESMDFVEVIFRVETEYGIEFYPGSAMELLAELLAPNPIEEKGLITAFGAKVLTLRMPELDAARLAEGQSAAGIEAQFTPRTFARVVQELLGARPHACPRCNSEKLNLAKASILLCNECQLEIPCPTGEEYLKDWAKSVAATDGE